MIDTPCVRVTLCSNPLSSTLTGREADSKQLQEMIKESPGQLNFTHFLTLFGEKMHGKNPVAWTLFFTIVECQLVWWILFCTWFIWSWWSGHRMFWQSTWFRIQHNLGMLHFTEHQAASGWCSSLLVCIFPLFACVWVLCAYRTWPRPKYAWWHVKWSPWTSQLHHFSRFIWWENERSVEQQIYTLIAPCWQCWHFFSMFSVRFESMLTHARQEK